MSIGRILCFLTVAAAGCCSAPHAVADFIVAANTSASPTVSAGQTGQTFDVNLFANTPDAFTGYVLSFGVSGPGPNPFVFTSVGQAGNPPYLFPGSAGPAFADPPLASDIALQYSDEPAGGTMSTVSGGSYNVGRVGFDVSASATPGTYSFTYLPDNSGFTDPDLNLRQPTAFFSGTIEVLAASAVPEPASWALLGIGLVCGCGIARRANVLKSSSIEPAARGSS